MKMSKALVDFKWLALVAIVVATLAGCKKDEDTIATVIVKNEFDQPVAGALVHLFAGNENANCEDDDDSVFLFDTCATTNSAGTVSWNFSKFYKEGQSGFAVLDIRATKGALEGTGIINVEEKTTTEEEVFIE